MSNFDIVRIKGLNLGDIQVGADLWDRSDRRQPITLTCAIFVRFLDIGIASDTLDRKCATVNYVNNTSFVAFFIFFHRERWPRRSLSIAVIPFQVSIICYHVWTILFNVTYGLSIFIFFLISVINSFCLSINDRRLSGLYLRI
jgi:hypothetical protein